MSRARWLSIVVSLSLFGCDGKDEPGGVAKSGASAAKGAEPGSSEEAAGSRDGAAGAPQPAKLHELAERYAQAKIQPEADAAGTLSPHGAKYQVQALRAAAGDGEALGVLLGAKVEEEAWPKHAANLEMLLLGFGDEAFAEVLAKQTPGAIDEVLRALDEAAKTRAADAPDRYRQTHPKTFALQPASE